MYCLPIGNKLLFYSAEQVVESFMNAMPMEHNAAPKAALVPLKRMVAISLGNALEFYDFMIFSFFAVQIAHTIIPSEQGLLLTLATFGVGFCTRPLGAFVIGRYGDRAGRKPAMMWSFGLMGVSILGTALTPSYANIGVAAPVLLLCFRLLQGFALGGEVGPITAYAAEAAPPGHRARYVSMLGNGAGRRGAVLGFDRLYPRTAAVARGSGFLWLAHRASARRFGRTDRVADSPPFAGDHRGRRGAG